MRTCVVCNRADNPLNKLRFRKHVDGQIYCDDHSPTALDSVLRPVAPNPPGLSPQASSAGSLVVIACPACRGMSNKPHGKTCMGCAGYGSVRIASNNLVVYQPKVVDNGPPPPQLLTEA
jgi:hypothetical protein